MAAVSTPQPARAASELMARMIALNPGVHSFEASIQANVHMRSFPYLSPQLQGKVYHKDPNLNKIVFTGGLPAIAKQFSKIYPRMESPSDWNRIYVVTQGDDNGGITAFKLVPRKHGRVDHIDVRVDDKTAAVISMRWAYNDGSGYALMQQQYATIDGHYVVVKQTGHVEQSIYKADIDSTLSNYKFNPTLSNSFFNS
jgi:outer membrane lipoprotein-sorting protein